MPDYLSDLNLPFPLSLYLTLFSLVFTRPLIGKMVGCVTSADNSSLWLRESTIAGKMTRIIFNFKMPVHIFNSQIYF